MQDTFASLYLVFILPDFLLPSFFRQRKWPFNTSGFKKPYDSFCLDMAGALRSGATRRSFSAKEQVIEFQYDAINRLIHKIYIGKDQQIDYSYDDAARPNSKGMLTGVVDLSGTTDFWYDESVRAVTTVKTISGVTGSFTIERDYDAFGRMASLTYPDSAHEVVQYGYDQAGNLSSAGIYAAFSDYNALGQPGRVDYGNGVDTLLQYYDGTIPGAVSYRLESIRTVKSGSNRQWIEYAYDNNGNLTDITDVLDPLRSGHYIYNYRDMLGKAQVQDPDGNPVEILMSYGRTGNIESNSRVGSYTYYHSRPHAVRAAGANTYNYDYNGNMTTRVSGARTQSLLFDFENRLSSITEGVNRNEYLYDYTGARVKKQILVSGAVTSTTVYIGGIYEQKNGENIKHIFAGGRRVASRKGSSTFYFHPDHLGSLSLVTNAAGASYQAETYYPFGGARNSDPADPAEFEYKFTGQENDPETGLYYYGARYYDPEIGRFISPDSIVQAPADPQTLNRYSYCRNNPLRYSDPSGRSFFESLIRFLFGPIFGGLIFGDTPETIIKGVAINAISATLFNAGGDLATVVEAAATSAQTANIAAAGIHFAAGAASGAIGAAIMGGDVGLGALSGGISGGVSRYAGGYLPKGFGYQLAGRSLIGGITGGITSEIYGKGFGEGFALGATTGAFGYFFNEYYHEGQTYTDNRVVYDEVGLEDPLIGEGDVLGVAGIIRSAGQKITFYSAKQLSKLLGVSVGEFEEVIKKQIVRQLSTDASKIGARNPDIGINEAGNIVLRNVQTGKTVVTDLPFESFMP